MLPRVHHRGGLPRRVPKPELVGVEGAGRLVVVERRQRREATTAAVVDHHAVRRSLVRLAGRSFVFLVFLFGRLSLGGRRFTRLDLYVLSKSE